MIDIIKGEGSAAGKAFPPVIAIGSDAYSVIKDSVASTANMLEEWKAVIISTDVSENTARKGANGNGSSIQSNGRSKGRRAREEEEEESESEDNWVRHKKTKGVNGTGRHTHREHCVHVGR